MKFVLAGNETCLGTWKYATTKLSSFKSRQYTLILTSKRVILNTEEKNSSSSSEMSVRNVTGFNSFFSKIRKKSFLLYTYFCLIFAALFLVVAVVVKSKLESLPINLFVFFIPAGVALILMLINLVRYLKSTQIKLMIDIYNTAFLHNTLSFSFSNFSHKLKKSKNKKLRIVIDEKAATAIIDNFGKLAIANLGTNKFNDFSLM